MNSFSKKLFRPDAFEVLMKPFKTCPVLKGNIFIRKSFEDYLKKVLTSSATRLICASVSSG